DVNRSQIKDVRGIYYFAEPLARSGKLALLFPGEGSQYVGMLGDLCSHFPIVRQVFDRADSISAMADVYPPPGREERERAAQPLCPTGSGALKAVLIENPALSALFQRLALRPDAVPAHSSGDFTAGLAAGIFDHDEAMLQRLSRLWHAYDEPQENGAEAG